MHQLIEFLQIASQVIMLVYHTKLLSVMDSMSRDALLVLAGSSQALLAQACPCSTSSSNSIEVLATGPQKLKAQGLPGSSQL